ncbi:MerR family DNA-binding transcriptional regulator [Lentilactobacillus laojiaonis]|nr:MerR family DNA-binding transcriptional regulator [Lentilactobacillus laojiaonis]
MANYTMSDISQKYNVSQDTIRYYDKAGLMPFIKEMLVVVANLMIMI